MASGWQWRRRGLSVQRLSIVWDGIPPENGSLGVGQFSVTPVVAAVVDEFLGSGVEVTAEALNTAEAGESNMEIVFP